MWNEIHRESDEANTKELVLLLWSRMGLSLSCLINGGGKDQENLTGVLWQCLWPYILNYLYVHVYTRSTNTYHVSPYPRPMREDES